MAKSTRSWDDKDDDKPGKSEDAPGHNKPAPKDLPAGGTAGNTTVVAVDPDDYMTEQEKAPAPAYVEPVQPAPAEPMKLGPKEPYPIGDPPTAEDEARRAAGLPREGA